LRRHLCTRDFKRVSWFVGGLTAYGAAALLPRPAPVPSVFPFKQRKLRNTSPKRDAWCCGIRATRHSPGSGFPVTPGPTMDRSSSPRPCKNRSRLLVPKPHISGSPGENGYIESFNARLRDELLNGEIFYTLREAQIVIESWRRHYTAIRPHTG
jgi:hypothetical protein